MPPLQNSGNLGKEKEKRNGYNNEELRNEEEENVYSNESKQEVANKLYSNKMILAPMVRASTTPLRTLCIEYGADLVYSEEIIDRSILNCDRIKNTRLGTVDYVRKMSALSKKQQKRLKNDSNSAIILRKAVEIEKDKFIYQMGTGEAGFALQAANYIVQDIDALDINMGCPKKFSISGGMGSALLSDLPRACDIIKTLSNNLTIPVSAKIRLLPSVKETIHFCQSLVSAGVNAITIHARHVGDDTALIPAKYKECKEVLMQLKNNQVPMIINGDLYTHDDIKQMKEFTSATSVMLARPALYNPSIFSKTNTIQTNRTHIMQQYIRHAVRWQTNYKNTKYMICEMMNNRRHLQSRTTELPQEFLNGLTIGTVCAASNIQDICKLWDVDWQKENQQMLHSCNTVLSGEHVYKDDYFLNHESFSKNKKQKI